MTAHRIPFDLFSEMVSTVDPGDAASIYVDRSPMFVPLVSAGAETRTLARPTKEGAILFLYMRTDAGDITLTVTGGFNEDGETTMVFSDAGQLAAFVSCYDGTNYHWRRFHWESARAVFVADATTYTVLASNSGKTHVLPDLTANITITLPAVQAGLEYEFVYKGVAADGQNWVIDTGSDTNYYLGGLVHLDHDAGSAGDEVVPIAGDGNSNSKLTVVTPSVGTVVKMVCDGTNWILSGFVNSATVPSFADQ